MSATTSADPQGRKAGRSAGGAAGQVRTGDQPQGRPGARPGASRHRARARRRGDRLPNLATELVHLKPDVIVTSGTPGTLAAMQATRTIPIVMASSADPVNAGLVARLARPRRERYGIYNPGCGVGRQTTGVSQASDPGALARSRPLESEQSGHRIFAPTGKRRLCTAHAKSRRCA